MLCLVCELCTRSPCVCPDVLSTVGETSYGIWVGFIKLDEVLTLFLFNYLFVSEVQSLLLSG